jgi:sulfur carrier protein
MAVHSERPPPSPHGGATPVSVIVNGTPKTVTAGAGVAALLDDLGLRVGSVVVELNGVVLAASESGRATLADGDTVEIVRAVAGG